MVLVEFLFVDRALEPSFPTGVQALPRNALVVFQFSELVDPSSVNAPVRAGNVQQVLAARVASVRGDSVIEHGAEGGSIADSRVEECGADERD